MGERKIETKRDGSGQYHANIWEHSKLVKTVYSSTEEGARRKAADWIASHP